MKIRPFEIGLLVVFAILAIVSIFLLRNISSDGSSPGDEGYVGPVQIWGTVPATPVNTVLNKIKEQDEALMGVTYRYIPQENFNDTLTEAIADGIGPDILFVSHEELVEQRRRIVPTSYDSWPFRDFSDTFIDGARIFALSDGIYGVPMLVDPLMMYWNRDVLTNNNFLTPPKTWEELVNIQLPAMVDRSFDRTVNRSVVSFGSYENVENAFGTLSMLLLQGGSNLVTESTRGTVVSYNISLDTAPDPNVKPFVSSALFYLRFSDPANALYSWNRSFGSDRTQFITGDLIFYFGFASEVVRLTQLNPNFNFDIAEVPQGDGATLRRTYGKHYALMPLRTADNFSGALNISSQLASDAAVSELANLTGMVPAKRSLVANGSNDIFGRLAYRSAPIAYAWLSPDITESDTILSDAITDVSENRSTIGEAVETAEQKLRSQY